MNRYGALTVCIAWFGMNLAIVNLYRSSIYRSSFLTKITPRTGSDVRVSDVGSENDGTGRNVTLEAVVAESNRIRENITHWVALADVKDSVYGYGMSEDPFGFMKKVDANTGALPLQHDFVTHLGSRLAANGQTIRFMEIGVSVLKSVHVKANFFTGADITAVDIEDPNPTIERLWKDKAFVETWTESSMGSGDMRLGHKGRTNMYVARYDGPRSNTIFYVTGDSRNSATWRHLAKNIAQPRGPMNLILSDGSTPRQMWSQKWNTCETMASSTKPAHLIISPWFGTTALAPSKRLYIENSSPCCTASSLTGRCVTDTSSFTDGLVYSNGNIALASSQRWTFLGHTWVHRRRGGRVTQASRVAPNKHHEGICLYPIHF